MAGDIGEAHVALLSDARTPATAACFERDEATHNSKSASAQPNRQSCSSWRNPTSVARPRRLGEDEARLYKEWIANDRRLRSLVTKMRHVATQATDLILEDAAAS